MKVFKFKLLQEPEVYHTMAVDRLDAVVDICELYNCKEQDITGLEQVEKLYAKKSKTKV